MLHTWQFTVGFPTSLPISNKNLFVQLYGPYDTYRVISIICSSSSTSIGWSRGVRFQLLFFSCAMRERMLPHLYSFHRLVRFTENHTCKDLLSTVYLKPIQSPYDSNDIVNRDSIYYIDWVRMRWNTQQSITEVSDLTDWLLGISSLCLSSMVYLVWVSECKYSLCPWRNDLLLLTQ